MFLCVGVDDGQVCRCTRRLFCRVSSDYDPTDLYCTNRRIVSKIINNMLGSPNIYHLIPEEDLFLTTCQSDTNEAKATIIGNK